MFWTSTFWPMRTPTPLKRAIFESGKTQREIARETGMDPSHLSRIVNGLHCDDATWAKLAAAIGRSVDELRVTHATDRRDVA